MVWLCRGLVKCMNKLDELFLIAGTLAMGFALTLQIVMRYIFNSPLVWSEEFARYIYIWICFIGVGYGVRKNLHIKMEAFMNIFHHNVQNYVEIAMTIAIMVFVASIIPSGIRYTVAVSRIPSPAMEIPMSWVSAAVPLGLIIGEVRLLQKLLKLLSVGGP